MYDVCDTDRGYFLANDIVVHNSAATLTKMAMINVVNDKILTESGFRILICVHDEIIGECPAKNADIVANRLSEIMVNSAKGICKVPMKCDTYIVSRWYEDDFSEYVHDKFTKAIEKGMTEEEAIKEAHSEYPQISYEYIKQMVNGTYVCGKHADI